MDAEVKPTVVSAVDGPAEEALKLLKGPMELYSQDRLTNEIDLIQIVRERLEEHGMKDKLAEGFDNNRFIQEAQGRNACAQQYNLNRYLTMQLMAAEEDTSLERYSLIYEVNAKDWLTIFDQKILPALVQYNLPVAL